MLPLLVRVERMETGQSSMHVFTSSPVRLGRNNLNDLPLDDPFVSLWHGMLQFDERAIQYLDLGSTNGSELDGKKAPANTLVPLGAEGSVVVGPLRVHVARGDASASAPKPRNFTLFDYKVSQNPPLLNEAALFKSPSPTLHWEAGVLPPSLAPTAVPLVEPKPGSPAPAKGFSPSFSEENWIAATSNALLPRYLKYREGWEKLHAQLRDALESVPAPRRAPVLQLLRARLPAIEHEAQFAQLLGDRGSPPAAPPLGSVAHAGDASPATQQKREAGPLPAPNPAPRSGRDAVTMLDFPAQPAEAGNGAPAHVRQANPAAGLLSLFADTYAPGPARGPGELEQFLRQLSAVIEAFAQAFVELRRGQQEFNRQMAFPLPLDPARRAMGSARDLLKHLLEPSPDSATRVRDLTRGFADVMVHQVALLSGMREGVRALLGELNPERFATQPSGKRLTTLFPFRSLAGWRRYGERYRALTEEERATESVLFGSEFAFAYTRIVGGPTTHPATGAAGRPADPQVGPTTRPAGGASTRPANAGTRKA